MDVDVGCGNAFGSGGDEDGGVDNTVQTVNNVVDGFQYTETQIGTANDFKAWIKDYMNAIVLKLREKGKPKEEIQEPTELKYIKIEKQAPSYSIQNDVTELALPKDMTASKKLTWSKDNEVRYIEEYKEFKEPKVNSLLINSLDNGIPSSFNILDKLKKKETNTIHDTNKVELLENKVESMHLQIDELSKKIEQILEVLNK